MTEVSGNIYGAEDAARFRDLMAEANVPLHPDLVPYVEEAGVFGPMLRHPLIYDLTMGLPGLTNRAYEQKRRMLDEALAAEDWHSVVFTHERPYRLDALLKYCCEYNGIDGELLPLSVQDQHVKDLAADVWIDSENIEQKIGDWRALVCNGLGGLWLGTDAEREAFDALPRLDHKDGPMIRAWRGGSVGDWSWTTDMRVAEFFSRRSGLPVRGHLIPVADVFGYFTRRSEAELMVRFTPFRERLVYPNGTPVSGNEVTLP